MRCKQHPSCECPKGQSECFLCGTVNVENDKFKFQYEQMAQHVQRGVTGIRTRGQYQRLLKRHGLTDDIPAKEIARCAMDSGKRERVREERINKFINRITPQLFQKAARWSR